MGKPKLIELYQYSKLDESQESELPNGVSILQILSRITQAQPALRTESKYKPYFEKVFYSPISHSILKDVFWWIFLDGWNPDKSLQEKLFERVAYSYVQLIILANHPYYAEPFLKSYPRLLSQSVYAAFCEAFSDSYSNFHNDFKEKLVNHVYQWVTGLKPAARSWLKWNLDDLEPVEIRNRRDLLKTSSLSPQTKSTGMNELEMNAASDDIRSVSFDLSKDQRKSTVPSHTSLRKIHKESHPSGKGPDFIRTAFMLNGKSPLVMHYLTKMNLQVESGMEMVVQRTELENLPPIDAPTYSDLIHDTFKSIHASLKSYREFYDRCVKENQEFAVLKKREFRELKQKEAMLLGKRREVKRLSDIIMLEFKLDKDSSSKATRKAIEDAVNSVK